MAAGRACVLTVTRGGIGVRGAALWRSAAISASMLASREMIVSSVWWTAPMASCVSRPDETWVSRRPDSRVLSSAMPAPGTRASGLDARGRRATASVVSWRSDLQMADEILQRALDAASRPSGSRPPASSRVARPEICCSSASKASLSAPGLPGLVDLVGERAQHLLDGRRSTRAIWTVPGSAPSWARLLPAASVSIRSGQRLDLARDGLGPLLDQHLDALLQRVDAALEPGGLALGQRFELPDQGLDAVRELARDAVTGQVHFGDAGGELFRLGIDQLRAHLRQGFDPAGKPVDLARQGEQLRGVALAVMRAVGEDRVADILDRQRQAAQFAPVGLVVAQPAHLGGQGRDLVRDVVDPAVAARLRHHVAQFADVAQHGSEQGPVAATRGQGIDLGGEMADLELDALIAVAGAVLRQARHLRFDPGQGLQHGIEAVAPVEPVEPDTDIGDHGLDRVRRGLPFGGGLDAGLCGALGGGLGGRADPGAEVAQILAQRRDPAFREVGGAGGLRRHAVGVEDALTGADVGDRGGQAVAAEGEARRGEAGGALRLDGLALDVDEPFAHRLDRIGDDAVARSCRSAAARSPAVMRCSVFSIQRAIESSAPAVLALDSRVSVSVAAAWVITASMSATRQRRPRRGAAAACDEVSIWPCDSRARRSDSAAMSSCSGARRRRESSSASSRSLWSSHSPSVMPARRAAAFAASRVRGSTPLTLQGKLVAMSMLA